VQAEWNVFRNLNQATLPVLDAPQAAMVFDATGGAPLYLNLLRRLTASKAAAAGILPAAVLLEDVWPLMLLDPEVARIYYNIDEQVTKHLSDEVSQASADKYLAFLTATVAGRPSPMHAARDFPFDHRYYYREADGSLFSCSSGFARDATLEAIRNSARPVRLLHAQALTHAMADAGTPASQRGWIAEQFVLGKVRHYGLLLHGLIRNAAAVDNATLRPDYFHTFLQQLGPADSSSHFVSLYQPRISNFPHVDAVIRMHPQQFAHAEANWIQVMHMLNFFLPAAPANLGLLSTRDMSRAKISSLAGISDPNIIIGVQITIANPIGHAQARQRFVQQAAAANSVWRANIPAGNIQFHFHWIVRNVLIPNPPLIVHPAAGAVPAHYESYSPIESYLDSVLA
jgi:hypothetical protein